MAKKQIVVLFACICIAVPFYISIWVWEGTELGHRWLYTGIATVLLVLIYCSFYYLSEVEANNDDY